MPVTTRGQALTALRAQRTSIKAADPVDAAKLRAVNRTIRALRSESNPQEESDERWDAFTEMRDMEATPALFNEEQWNESRNVLLSQIGSIPEDDDTPRVVDQGQVKGVIRRAALNAATELDPVRARCFEDLERFFDTYLEERPEEAVLTPLLADLNGGELGAVELAATLAALESNAGSLKPPAR